MRGLNCWRSLRVADCCILASKLANTPISQHRLRLLPSKTIPTTSRDAHLRGGCADKLILIARPLVCALRYPRELATSVAALRSRLRVRKERNLWVSLFFVFRIGLVISARACNESCGASIPLRVRKERNLWVSLFFLFCGSWWWDL